MTTTPGEARRIDLDAAFAAEDLSFLLSLSRSAPQVLGKDRAAGHRRHLEAGLLRARHALDALPEDPTTQRRHLAAFIEQAAARVEFLKAQKEETP